MFRFMRRFKKPLPPPEPGSSPEALWQADFSSIEASRFEHIDEERYATRTLDGALILELRKASLFAWADAGDYRYTDASIEAEIDFGHPGSRCAAGILLLKADDSSFIYVLVSSDGAVRMDLVFNGEPRVIVPWIDCPWVAGAESMVLSVVSRGPRIVVMLNGRFAFEAEDDSLESGAVAFAAQSYDEPAIIRLISFRIESRPLEAESDYIRFTRIIVADSAQRRRLAEGLFGQGYFVAALVQLRKIALQGEAEAQDRFLEAECLLRLELYEDAAKAIDACLAIDPSYDPAIEERYNLLYLRGDYARLREDLEADAARLASSPRLYNLLGHAHYNQGSWEKAAAAYGSAAEGDPLMPIYARNKAMALENARDIVAASGAWLLAAKGFYEQEAWDEASDCSIRLRERGFDTSVLASLDGMIAYGRGDLKTAKAQLYKLWKSKRADAPSSYVYGLILNEEGKRLEAIDAFRQAVALDPDRPIYRYRLAETLFMSGKDCDEEISMALHVAANDGWVLNLAGQAALAAGKVSVAAEYFEKALAALPQEHVPAINLSQAYTTEGRHEEAIRVLGSWPNRSASAANRLGNALAAAHRIEDAAKAYEKACVIGVSSKDEDSDPVEYRINLAAALFELGELSRAEDSLRQALEIREDPRALVLMGDIVSEFGDIGRAEMAYRAAIERDPHHALAMKRLATHYLLRHRYEQAAQVADTLSAIDKDSAAAIQLAIHDATTQSLACSVCGISWELPLPTPPAPRSRLKGEPSDDSPAGSCPDCGKVYCVACRKNDIVDGRFTCPECLTRLNLNDDRVRWLVLDRIKTSKAGRLPF